MKMKLKDLRSMERELKTLLTEKQVPIKVAFLLSQIIDEVVEQIERVEKHRLELVMKYGGEPDDENRVEVSEDRMEEFMNEFGDLLDLEIDINIIPIHIDLFENVRFTPLEIKKLAMFIKTD